jgi:CheY-like chemotaxis protein
MATTTARGTNVSGNRPSERQASDPPRATIVVLDDDGIVRKNLVRLLNLEGYAAFEAIDVDTLHSILEAAPIDVVLADSRLTDGNDGWATAMGLRERYPNLRMASVENGSGFLPDMVRKLSSTHAKMPGYFAQHPVEMLRQHWWINPFWEDDVAQVAELMGADRVIFGSDWPHIEGMPEPLDYVQELKTFNDADRRRILLDNVLELNTPHPV